MSTRSIGIAYRTTLGFSCIAALSFFLGFFALQQIGDVRMQALEIQDNWLQRVRVLAAANTSLNRYRMGSMQHILTNSSEEMSGYEAKATLRLSQIRDQMASTASCCAPTARGTSCKPSTRAWMHMPRGTRSCCKYPGLATRRERGDTWHRSVTLTIR